MMGLSRYPRPGHRLAPVTLRALLATPVPCRLLGSDDAAAIQFADLDEAAWGRFGPELCQRLGKAIVECVRAQLSTAPPTVRNRPLPRLPDGLRGEDLLLEPRTWNCLEKMQVFGLLQDLADLNNKTIGDLLALHGFGAKCLIDLLTSMEAVASGRTLPPARDSDEGSGPVVNCVEPRQRDGFALHLPLSAVRNLRLPRLPDGVCLQDLPLEARTRNCLEQHGYSERLPDLAERTIGEMLALPGFGMNCLRDLLCALEARQTSGKREPADTAPTPALIEFTAEEHATLEDELRSLVARACNVRRTSPAERNVRIAIRHFGFDGAGGTTLRQVGDAYGLTRERVRQICLRVTRAVQCSPYPAPLLDRALKAIDSCLPAEADAVEAELRSRGLTAGTFRMEGIARAAQLLSRKVPFELDVIDGRRMALHPERGRLARRLIHIAKKTIAHFGVTTTSDIAGLVEERTSYSVPPDFVASVLVGHAGFEWLDEVGGWFWLRTNAKNRVMSRIRKILAVAESIDISELRSGIARHHDMKGYAPPRRVLIELCRRLPDCEVEGTWVRAKGGIDWRQVLRGTEHTMVQILKEHGPLMQRATFEEFCLGSGMNRSTFYVFLDYSSVIERFAPGVYGLRGAAVEAGVVESLIPQYQPATTVRLDHDWTGDRKVWISYRLSEGMIGNGAFSVPGGMKKFLQGSYVLKAADGQPIGTLVVKENAGWGIGPFFRRRGGEPGDTLLIVFDLKARAAQVSIGDEALLDQYQTLASHAEDTSSVQVPAAEDGQMQV